MINFRTIAGQPGGPAERSGAAERVPREGSPQVAQQPPHENNGHRQNQVSLQGITNFLTNKCYNERNFLM